METCRVCHGPLENAASSFEGVCATCANGLALVPMPPPRRPPAPCARCKSTAFVRVLVTQYITPDFREAAIGQGGFMHIRSIPLAAVYEIRVSDMGFGLVRTVVLSPDFTRPRGLMARYICRTCGFTEIFCEDPESIPIGPEHMSDIVDYGPLETPYR